mgnify:CR=1 FL=1
MVDVAAITMKASSPALLLPLAKALFRLTADSHCRMPFRLIEVTYVRVDYMVMSAESCKKQNKRNTLLVVASKAHAFNELLFVAASIYMPYLDSQIPTLLS